MTDVVMPKMPGAELARRMRADRSDLRLIYTSGYADDLGSVRSAVAEGGAIIAKPFDVDTLLAAVETALAG